MRSKIAAMFAAAVALAIMPGCVNVPRLEGFGLPVTELVRRIKCELLEAVPEPVGKYQWMADWTTKIDLNLIVDDRAGLTPTVSFIDLRDTAIIPKVGSIMQNFTFGLGAGLNTIATRNDSLSFTLSLKEIREKRMLYACDKPIGLGLAGDLGLREWIAFSLEPVESAELTPGHHRPPASRGGSTRSLKQAVERRIDAESKLEEAKKQRASEQEIQTKQRDVTAAKRAEERALEDLAQERRGAGPTMARARLDPPIDSIAHQVQFVVLANATASPQWTLARFKGPSVSGPLAALTKSRTHTLNLVMGAPAVPGSKETSGEQSRQLLNQNLRSLIVPVPTQ